MKDEHYEDAVDAESLLSHSTSTDDQQKRIKRNKERRKLPACALSAGLLASHLLTALAAAWAGSHWWRYAGDVDDTCAKWTTHASPVTQEVAVKYSNVAYNGSFFHQTIYRGDASPEVDAAWSALGVDYRAMRIPEEYAEAAGLTKNHVKIRDKYGGGYPANMEGLHHLHCLNLLRKSSWYNFEYYKKMGEGPFKNEEHVVKVHITHCLDIIRQQLMCTADTGVLGQVWWNTEKPTPFVDFNTEHRCKNFDVLRQWAEKHQLPEADGHLPKDYLEPPAGVVYPEIP
ncbi:hypothetical protein BT63DRAFT_424170 [Microthyrium microscopicum]|uniref:Tat pathway signal sequence n=1 Tax=Microthyrium microscopicum TaxID=703497 RepID=A0A6A6UEJ1_9PEZI|nr:hypothetical protein BT63DRAFT_424170 [Microthyrium microscopicum]